MYYIHPGYKTPGEDLWKCKDPYIKPGTGNLTGAFQTMNHDSMHLDYGRGTNQNARARVLLCFDVPQDQRRLGHGHAKKSMKGTT